MNKIERAARDIEDEAIDIKTWARVLAAVGVLWWLAWMVTTSFAYLVGGVMWLLVSVAWAGIADRLQMMADTWRQEDQ